MHRRYDRFGAAACLILIVGLCSGPRIAHGQVVLEPDPKMPRFQLSNPRFEDGRQGKIVLLIDFKRQGNLAPNIGVELVTRMTNSSELKKVFGFQNYGKQSGTFRIAMEPEHAKRVKSVGAELFVIHELISSSSRARTEQNRMGNIEYQFKSSNSVTVGPAKARVTTRPWNQEDRRRVAAWVKFSAPIPLPSTQHALVSRENKAVPGMPAMAYRSEQWQPCEIIGVNSYGAKVRMDPPTETLSYYPNSRLAVLSSDAGKAKLNPAVFSPSIELIAGTMEPVPKDYEVVTDVSSVAMGTRVKAVVSDKLVDGEVYGVFAGRFLDVRVGSGFWAREHRLRPQYVYVAKAGTAAAAASKPSASSPSQSTRRLKRYVMSIPVPDGYARVDRNTPLVPGIKLGCSYAKKWEVVTLLKVYDDGAIRCGWDSWSNVAYDMSREDVIIARSLLAKLEPSSASQDSAERLWTDATGKFKVKATFVSLQDGTVKLRKPDGGELKIALEKLSVADRKVAEKLKK